MDSSRKRRVPLTGYTDRLSLRPGETLEFRLSAEGADSDNTRTVHSRLTQCVCADPNPAGPGLQELSAEQWYAPEQHELIEQPINAGSCAATEAVELLPDAAQFHMQATVWPTRLDGASQCIIACGALSLCIDADRRLCCRIHDHELCCSEALQERQWQTLSVQLLRKGLQLEVVLQCAPVDKPGPASNKATPAVVSRTATVLEAAVLDSLLAEPRAVVVAACLQDGRFVEHFNGKIEAPGIRAEHPDLAHAWSLSWDFSEAMHSCTVPDRESRGHPLNLHNFPTRAMTGSQWLGEEMCWRHAAAQYSAIHFHDDDLLDVGWKTSFSYRIPDDMPSGVYLMRIGDEEHEEALPFFVCAPSGKPGNRVCMLVPTFTYAIYGNHARPDWKPQWQDRIDQWQAYPWNPACYPGYGLSTYNTHGDGSGICHASHLRPLFNLRPGYSTFGESTCSGLRHFPADSHLWAWLHAMDIGFDVITDRELHDEGSACIEGYDMLLTSSHPEYHTSRTLDALQQYREQGGHLSYLGGNGFYWRIAVHAEQPHALEIRRAEAGIRAWAAEPGEYYQAFDGQYGGLWRRNGRPPQQLCGLGFSAQGEFNGSYYKRCNHDPEFDWVFEGIDGDIIGDFGLSGGGAAGFELDRADTRLGTPVDATVLATSENHGEDFILVPEEVLTHLTTLPGEPASELLHANLLWHEPPDGGSLFAVGSITFCGSLPHNDFDNPVSRLLKNVVDHVLERD